MKKTIEQNFQKAKAGVGLVEQKKEQQPTIQQGKSATAGVSVALSPSILFAHNPLSRASRPKMECSTVLTGAEKKSKEILSLYIQGDFFVYPNKNRPGTNIRQQYLVFGDSRTHNSAQLKAAQEALENVKKIIEDYAHVNRVNPKDL